MLGPDAAASLLLLANQGKHRLFYTLAILAGALLVAALIIRWVERWRKSTVAAEPQAGDQLSEFRTLYERGELSEEEFNHIRQRLGAQMKEELQVETKPGGDEPPDWSIQVDKPDSE